MILNPSDHPVGTKVLMTCPQFALLTEAEVLRWSELGHAKVRWVLSNLDGWISCDRLTKHPITEVLYRPGLLHGVRKLLGV